LALPRAPVRTAGSTKVVRKTTKFHHRSRLWFPQWAAHRNVQPTKPDHWKMKNAAEDKWRLEELPSEKARKEGKPAWPFHTLP
jgi:hypothetical protein